MSKASRNPIVSFLFIFIISMSAISCSNDDDTVNGPDTSTGTGTDTGTDSNESITDPLAHGEQAHQNHCYKCHSDDVYTRENRFVKSIEALSKQVVRCKDGNDVPWFDEDTDAVVQFLNKKYYRF